MTAQSAAANVAASVTPPAPPVETTDALLGRLLDKFAERTEKTRGEITLTASGIDFGNFDGMVRWAKYIVSSRFCPEDIDTVEKAIVCIVMGRSVGLDPFQAVQSIAPINGRPMIWGDAPLAIARRHPDWIESGFEEYYTIDGKRFDMEPDPDEFKPSMAAICTTHRKGQAKPRISRFSVSMATKAGLLGNTKKPIYNLYLFRMLRFRARGYCLRDNFGDALKGLHVKELYSPEEMKKPPQESVNGDTASDNLARGEEIRQILETPDQDAPKPESTEAQLKQEDAANGQAEAGSVTGVVGSVTGQKVQTPPQEFFGEAGVASDLCSDFEEQIQAAKTLDDLASVEADAKMKQEQLGSDFLGKLLKAIEKRRHDIAPFAAKGRKKASAADIQ